MKSTKELLEEAKDLSKVRIVTDEQKKKISDSQKNRWSSGTRKNGTLNNRIHAMNRIMDKLSINESNCWVFNGASGAGYGKIDVRSLQDRGGRLSLVHRIVYENLIGSIQDKMVIDHLCRNTICCNPLHLEVVTHRENVMRGLSPAMTKERFTHEKTCRNGHERTIENTYYIKLPTGRVKRECKNCRSLYMKKYVEKHPR